MELSPKAVILFGHGSRDPLWRRPIDAVAARLRTRHKGVSVQCAFLELTTPDLPTVAATMVAAGASEITIVPMFLGTGRHAREDLPLVVANLRKVHPNCNFLVQVAVGEDPRVLDLLADVAAGPVYTSEE